MSIPNSGLDIPTFMRFGYSNRFPRISPANLPAESETPHVVSRTQGSDWRNLRLK